VTSELELAIDHVTLSVAALPRARAFYSAVLAPIGLEVVGEVSAEQSGSVAFIGFGRGRKGQLWIAEDGPQSPATHICFRAASRAAVRAFHQVGLANGGKDNGSPGIREIYHPAYYAAFIIDPEGHNIEAVCFEPEGILT
jgi:catechol 2,3-dioxygenase-like lactoylglutathione lyase family enzyme